MSGAKYCRYAVPSLGLRATGLEAAPFSKIFNHAISLSEKQIGFEFKIVRAIQKSCRTERPEDPGLQDREREPRSGKISSLSQRLLKHSQRAKRLLKKARGVQRGKAFPLWSVWAQRVKRSPHVRNRNFLGPPVQPAKTKIFSVSPPVQPAKSA